MSGGSYDYFYSKVPDELRGFAGSLAHMADECQKRAESGREEKHWKTGEVIDLAALAEAGDFLRMLSFRMSGLARVMQEIGDVPRAVEWWKSGDTGIDDVVDAWRRVTSQDRGK